MMTGKLRYLLAALATVPNAAVVVEDRYSAVFKLDRVRPAVIAEGLGEAAARFPSVPIVFAETRPLAQEWTYRFLGAALAHHDDEHGATGSSTTSRQLARCRRRSRRRQRFGFGRGARPGRRRSWPPPSGRLGRLPARSGYFGSAAVRSTSTRWLGKPSWATPSSVLAEVNAGPSADSVSRVHTLPSAARSSPTT